MRDDLLGAIWVRVHQLYDRVNRLVRSDGSVAVRPIGNDDVLPAILPHLHDDYGSEMAQNGAFSGIPKIVYQENLSTPDEYDTSAIVGVWDFANTTDPHSGTYCIDGTLVEDGDIMEFDNGACEDCVAISGWIKLTAWSETKGHHLAVYIYDKTAGEVVGNEVLIDDYVDVTLIGTYQSAAIPLSEFGITSSQVDAVRIRVDSNSPLEVNAPKFFMDDVQLEAEGGGLIYRAEPLPGTWYHAKYLKTTFIGIPAGFHTDGMNPLIDPYQLFNIAKLTNGIVNIIKARGLTVQALNIKCIADYSKIPEMGAPYPISKAADNTVAYIFQLTWAKPLILKYEDGDYSELIVNDDLEGLGSLEVSLGGYYELRSS